MELTGSIPKCTWRRRGDDTGLRSLMKRARLGGWPEPGRRCIVSNTGSEIMQWWKLKRMVAWPHLSFNATRSASRPHAVQLCHLNKKLGMPWWILAIVFGYQPLRQIVLPVVWWYLLLSMEALLIPSIFKVSTYIANSLAAACPWLSQQFKRKSITHWWSSKV